MATEQGAAPAAAEAAGRRWARKLERDQGRLDVYEEAAAAMQGASS